MKIILKSSFDNNRLFSQTASSLVKYHFYGLSKKLSWQNIQQTFHPPFPAKSVIIFFFLSREKKSALRLMKKKNNNRNATFCFCLQNTLKWEHRGGTDDASWTSLHWANIPRLFAWLFIKTFPQCEIKRGYSCRLDKSSEVILVAILQRNNYSL